MAGVVPSVLSSRLFSFLLFIVLVWVAVDLGRLLVGVAPGLPGSVKTLIAPSAADADEQAKL